MSWRVTLSESVLEDLRWFGRKQSRRLLGSIESTMKVIPLSEAKMRLSHYARLCRKEPIVVTVNGVPAFQLTPVRDDDDLINQLLEHNEEFRQMLAERLKEPTVSIAEAAKRL